MQDYTKQDTGTALLQNSYFSLSSDIVEFKNNGMSIDNKVYTFRDIPIESQKKKIFTHSSQSFGNEGGLVLENCAFFPLEKIEISKNLQKSAVSNF